MLSVGFLLAGRMRCEQRAQICAHCQPPPSPSIADLTLPTLCRYHRDMHIFTGIDAGKSARSEALAAAKAAIAAGKVICLPTDTVYGIGADPFNADAVTALLAAKSRTRAMPPPVLVADADQAAGLLDSALFNSDLAAVMHALIDSFWPGALTIILPAHPQLGWDLGETNGTVALRMPDHDLALELLKETGPLAVTSANKTGEPPAVSIDTAVDQLGSAVAVYLDAGISPKGVPSTIVKLNPEQPRIAELIRLGAMSAEALVHAAGISIR